MGWEKELQASESKNKKIHNLIGTDYARQLKCLAVENEFRAT